MKKTAFIFLAAAISSQFAAAQVYTNPVGYSTTTLAQGYNCVGLTLQNPTLVAGTFEAVNGTALTDDQLSFTPTAGRIYVLEITASVTAALKGTIQEITSASVSGTTITTTDNLGLAGLAVGDSYSIRLAPTLEELFTTVSLSSGGVLQAALSSTNADIVWVPTGPGTYNQYYLHTSAAFRSVATNTASPNVSITYADGLFIQKKGASAASLSVAGEVKMVGTNSVGGQGYNLISIVCPAGKNLWNIGLEDDIQPALSATNADIVWVQQSNLSYQQYYRHTSGNWRDVANPTVNLTQLQCEAVVLPSGILVQRKAASSFTIDLNGPQ